MVDRLRVNVQPATADRWDDVAGAFGRQARNPDSCWCQRFLATPDVTNQQALQAEIEAATVPPGLIAYVGGKAVGWSRVVPRSTLPGILKNRALARVLSDDPLAWWVTCFAIHQDARGHGVGAKLLSAAADHARQHGASYLEGHPVDVSQLKASRVSGSALFTGTSSMFQKAGFHEIGRTYPSRPVMRRDFS